MCQATEVAVILIHINKMTEARVTVLNLQRGEVPKL